MTRSHAAKGPSQRQLRAGELLRHALAEIFMLEDIDDAALKGELVTVAEVRVSPDLKHATAFVTGVKGANEALAKALNKHSRFLRGALARKVELKFVPEIVFAGDTSAESSERIDELLRSPEVQRDLK
jgi:ribosome-binding factor A